MHLKQVPKFHIGTGSIIRHIVFFNCNFRRNERSPLSYPFKLLILFFLNVAEIFKQKEFLQSLICKYILLKNLKFQISASSVYIAVAI